ncbi:hypothetical protein NQZ68_010425 [Dissostichus eleginoides]|nr:hypothetical protein NQZ68_010425 [Dissostichus eleginoides]
MTLVVFAETPMCCTPAPPVGSKLHTLRRAGYFISDHGNSVFKHQQPEDIKGPNLLLQSAVTADLPLPVPCALGTPS